MTKRSVEDYLKEGMYGPKEIKPAERRLYLGTFRERVIVVLTKVQVGKDYVYDEVVELMKDNDDAQLLLNGHMNYSFLSKYIKIATDLAMDYTVVTNNEYDSKYGLVLTKDHAINVENITISEKNKTDKGKNIKRSIRTKKSFLRRFFSIL